MLTPEKKDDIINGRGESGKTGSECKRFRVTLKYTSFDRISMCAETLEEATRLCDIRFGRDLVSVEAV